ncbi:unnamed protein product [Cylindrotheca closterium]|uniref:Uncharacterized protein n=1 Tax=Cylindrotheca closterium TaxID=2856 RepID=A0AAD2JJ13_9STRA|nr:unnamed protein product [Cylindrotheca closterium]
MQKGQESAGKPTTSSNLNGTTSDIPAAVDLDNLRVEKECKGILTYSQSKSILEATTMGIVKELEPKGVMMVKVVFPPLRASTDMAQAVSSKSLLGAMTLFYPTLKLMFCKDNGESAAKAVTYFIWGATSTKSGLLVGRSPRQGGL